MDRLLTAIETTIKSVRDALTARIVALEARAPVPGPAGERGPQGEKGEKGEPGSVGLKGLDGSPGRDGRDGKDGRDGEKGADGVHGNDGLDGLGFDDLDMTQGEDYRTFTFKFVKGSREKVFSFYIPAQVFQGVYVPGHTYLRGDAVTKGGGQWTALRETATIPGDGQSDWVLSVARGREGKAGPRGEKGESGLHGKDGRDLTHIDPASGVRW